MRELSLFTGAGGGILGTHMLGWRPIGYVEWDDYCQRVLAARITDGLIPSAPIFGDVREFVQSGAAEQYRGFADVVSAGFPCQPFSNAGNQLGADDPRNMWPATADVIRAVRPAHVILENVPGLLTCGYAGTVIGDLAKLGYVGQWGCISASSQGARHRRLRWWVVAHANNEWSERWKQQQESCTGTGDVANAAKIKDCSYSEHAGSWQHSRPKRKPRGSCVCGRIQAWPGDPADIPESGLGRVVDGLAPQVDRIGACGNGQVPRVVAAAWELLK